MSEVAQPEENSGGTGPGSLVGGRFRVEEKIAAGGMGIVYRAVQEPLGRPVALKVLRKPQDARLDKTYSERFLLEAAVVANLNHPNTVVVHDYGNEGGVLYFAMEYVDGLTLSEHIKKHGPLSPGEGVHVAKQIASSLLDAHADGLVHRDLKPGNVMLLTRSGDPLFVKVLDFGLVKIAGGDEETKKKLTQSGILMGSPRYMAPEQVRGRKVDARTDVYSFGALMCFILTGKPPFAAGSQFEAMRAHVHAPPPRLVDLAPSIQASEGLESLVARCLAKEPGDRYASMTQLLASLESLNSEVRVSVPSPHATLVQGGANGDHGAGEDVTNSSMTSFLSQAIVSPQTKGMWATRIVLMTLVIAAGVAMAVLIPQWAASAPVVATTLPPLEPEPVNAPAPVVQEQLRTELPVVRLTLEPENATVTRDGVLLGSGVAELPIPPGETWELTLEARGYETRTITLASESRPISITLDAQVVDETEVEEVARPGLRPTVERPVTLSPREPLPETQHSPAIRDPWGQQP